MRVRLGIPEIAEIHEISAMTKQYRKQYAPQIAQTLLGMPGGLAEQQRRTPGALSFSASNNTNPAPPTDTARSI